MFKQYEKVTVQNNKVLCIGDVYINKDNICRIDMKSIQGQEYGVVYTNDGKSVRVEISRADIIGWNHDS